MPPTTRTGSKKRYTFYSGDKRRAKANKQQDRSKRMKNQSIWILMFFLTCESRCAPEQKYRENNGSPL